MLVDGHLDDIRTGRQQLAPRSMFRSVAPPIFTFKGSLQAHSKKSSFYCFSTHGFCSLSHCKLRLLS